MAQASRSLSTGMGSGQQSFVFPLCSLLDDHVYGYICGIGSGSTTDRIPEALVAKFTRMQTQLAGGCQVRDSLAENRRPAHAFLSSAVSSPPCSAKSRAQARARRHTDTRLLLGRNRHRQERCGTPSTPHPIAQRGPFIAIQRGAIPENLMEAEFLGAGHRGAYTGAEKHGRDCSSDRRRRHAFSRRNLRHAAWLATTLLRVMGRTRNRAPRLHNVCKVDVPISAAPRTDSATRQGRALRVRPLYRSSAADCGACVA